MAEEKRPNADGAEPQEAKSASRFRLLRRRWLLALIALVAVNGVALGMVLWLRGGDQSAASPEITLGQFRFEAGQSPGTRIAQADFRLHVSLLERAEKEGRALLETKRFRVQQQVEQLLRRAHGGDFEDPALVELRRLLQETINHTLGKFVIEEVIVTDLSLVRADPVDGADSKTSGQEMAGGVNPRTGV